MPEPQVAAAADAGGDDQPTPTKRFDHFLREHRSGGLNNEASEKMAEAVTAAYETGKKATVEIKVVIDPKAEGDGSIVVVSDGVKAKIPQPKRPTSIFFADQRGNLSRQHPNQQQFDGLREANSEKS